MLGEEGPSCVWAGMISNANPVGTVSAESSFRMRVFLLVNRDRGPRAADRSRRHLFRFTSSGTIQPHLPVDKFDIP